MKYSNETVRRQDRLLEEENALRLLQTAEYGILSMQAAGGGGYGIPVNYVWDGLIPFISIVHPKARNCAVSLLAKEFPSVS